MAMITGVRGRLNEMSNVTTFTWTGMAGGDYTNTIVLPNFPDRAVTISAGTIGTSTVDWFGTNDPTLFDTDPSAAAGWTPLTDGDNNVWTKNGIGQGDQIKEPYSGVAGKVTAGTGTGLKMILTAIDKRG